MIALSPTAILSVLVPLSAAVALAGFRSHIGPAEYWRSLGSIQRGDFADLPGEEADIDLV